MCALWQFSILSFQISLENNFSQFFMVCYGKFIVIFGEQRVSERELWKYYLSGRPRFTNITYIDSNLTHFLSISLSIHFPNCIKLNFVKFKLFSLKSNKIMWCVIIILYYFKMFHSLLHPFSSLHHFKHDAVLDVKG